MARIRSALLVIAALSAANPSCGNGAHRQSEADSAKQIDIETQVIKGVGSTGPTKAIRITAGIPADEIGLPSQMLTQAAGIIATRVQLDSVPVWDDSEGLRCIVAHINPGSGTIIKVEALPLDNRALIPRSSLSATDERMFSRAWCFAGLPGSQLCSFVEMIRQCPMSTRKARHITALYVRDSCNTNKTVELVWAVSLDEMPPQPMKGVSLVPDSLLDNGPTSAIVILDGKTGAPLRAMTF